MPGFKLFFGTQVFVLCAGLLVVSAHGENLKPGENLKASAAGTNAPSPIAVLSLTTELQQETVPGFPPATRVIASAGTNQFGFRAPRGFRIDGMDPKKIVLTSTNQVTFVSLRVLRGFPPQPPVQKKKSPGERYRKLLLAQHAGAKILSEFTRAVDGSEGVAFDLQWPVAGALQSARVVFAPAAAGLLEFTLSTRPELFHGATYKFNSLLLSFRSGKNGKLEIVPLSNKF
ncbi:MAG TPA: hypothetical protein VN761_11785 [Candidatus Polarisedimenticolia bacterium]|nr:hypothetical protein [Candidatus Polarisedimenticolia bacterium]